MNELQLYKAVSAAREYMQEGIAGDDAVRMAAIRHRVQISQVAIYVLRAELGCDAAREVLAAEAG